MSSTEAAKAVNERFKTSYTRNSVIGRANRKGLVRKHTIEIERSRKSTAKRLNKRYPRPKAKMPRDRNQPITALFRSPEPKPQPFTCERVVDVVPLNVSLIELKNGQCRWPTAGTCGSSYRFCGQEILEGSYCWEHFRLSLREAA